MFIILKFNIASATCHFCYDIPAITCWFYSCTFCLQHGCHWLSVGSTHVPLSSGCWSLVTCWFYSCTFCLQDVGHWLPVGSTHVPSVFRMLVTGYLLVLLMYLLSSGCWSLVTCWFHSCTFCLQDVGHWLPVGSTHVPLSSGCWSLVTCWFYSCTFCLQDVGHWLPVGSTRVPSVFRMLVTGYLLVLLMYLLSSGCWSLVTCWFYSCTSVFRMLVTGYLLVLLMYLCLQDVGHWLPVGSTPVPSVFRMLVTGYLLDVGSTHVPSVFRMLVTGYLLVLLQYLLSSGCWSLVTCSFYSCTSVFRMLVTGYMLVPLLYLLSSGCWSLVTCWFHSCTFCLQDVGHWLPVASTPVRSVFRMLVTGYMLVPLLYLLSSGCCSLVTCCFHSCTFCLQDVGHWLPVGSTPVPSVFSMVVTGYRRPLDKADLWLLNEEDRCENIMPHFERQWRKEMIKCQR